MSQMHKRSTNSRKVGRKREKQKQDRKKMEKGKRNFVAEGRKIGENKYERKKYFSQVQA